MPDVLARVELDLHVDDAPLYSVHQLDSGWVLEIQGAPGVSMEQVVNTEAEAYLRAAQLTNLLRRA